jgi:type II secretory pathway predicted ATPase ExeA
VDGTRLVHIANPKERHGQFHVLRPSRRLASQRAALAALDPARHTIISLPNPTIGARGIHHAIVAALGGVPRTHMATLIPQAADTLAIEAAERGRTPVLILDEAHLLDHVTQLEGIRMLTNSDMDSRSPFACLLVGQPTLRRRIKLGVRRCGAFPIL